MASFKLNIAHITGCPPPKTLAAALEEFGLPESEEFGVLQFSATSEAVFGTVVRRTQQAVQRVDPESKEVTSTAVEKVTLYPFGVKPSTGVLEVYAGSGTGLEQVGNFFAGCLALPTAVEQIELDIPSAIEKLTKAVQRFQLKGIRVNDYAHNSYMLGVYAPKFLDSTHGMEFMEQYSQFIASAAVRFQGPSGKVSVTLTPKTNFAFSCNEDDQPTVQSILRKLV